MAEIPVDIEVYDNENLDKPFALKLGDEDTAWNLTGATFKMNVETPTGTVMLTLKNAASGSNYIYVSNASGGLISIRIAKSFLAENGGKTFKYDLVMTTNNAPKRLWGGSLIIHKGVTE